MPQRLAQRRPLESFIFILRETENDDPVRRLTLAREVFAIDLYRYRALQQFHIHNHSAAVPFADQNTQMPAGSPLRSVPARRYADGATARCGVRNRPSSEWRQFRCPAPGGVRGNPTIVDPAFPGRAAALVRKPAEDVAGEQASSISFQRSDQRRARDRRAKFLEPLIAQVSRNSALMPRFSGRAYQWS